MINAENSLVIHLDSRFGNKIETNSQGRKLTTNYTYTLIEGIPIPDSKMCEISLYNATIPYSFYNVRARINNGFGITLNGTEVAIFHFPEGNYTAVSLKNEFLKLQQASSVSQVKNLRLSIAYDRTTLKYTFRVPKTGSLNSTGNNLLSSITTNTTSVTQGIQYTLPTTTSGSGSGAYVDINSSSGTTVTSITAYGTATFSNSGYSVGDTLTVSASSIGASNDLVVTLTAANIVNEITSLSIDFSLSAPMFGFVGNSDDTFTIGTDDLVLVSTNCVDISDSIHGLYIRQNLSSKSTLDNENGTFSNILARIPINTNPGGIIFHTPSNSTHRALVSLQTIQTIGIKLTDDRNRTIDLNGLNFQVSIMITLVDKVRTAPELTRITRRKNELFLAQQRLKTNKQKSKKKKR
jgi:hypothetical protein